MFLTFPVQDLSGRVTKIVFHDESNVYIHPRLDQGQCGPLGLGSCLIPRHFMLLVGVHWRCFHDGTVGIRINDLASVYLIDMIRNALSPEYKREMEQAVADYDNTPRIRAQPPSFFEVFQRLFNL
ncbi:hypothetical protein ElyMa_006083000 [Elysia marginata]|uniref:Uncharacterized protein n=1 Tax=Elysia marginata TaxID=1093978 RepID=A0AAV4GQV1_9GAST|nr:hypothetical protein ElyMa_006083000 [Elysia marginata]